MAQGTLLLMNELTQYIGDGTIDFDNDTFKLAIITTGVGSLNQTAALPKWADYSANEIAIGGNYSGPITLTSPTYNRSGAVTTFDAADLATIAAHASNATTGKTAIIYSDTATQTVDAVIGYIDLTTDGGTTALDLVNNSLDIAFGVSGIFTLTRS